MTLDLEPQGALERATSTARAAFRTRLLEAGWPAEVADGLGRVAAEVCVGSAWGEFVHTISAWQRPRERDDRIRA